MPWAQLSFVAWCAARGGRFRGGAPLHAWTRRYGYVAAVGGASALVWPAGRCSGPVPGEALALLLVLLSYVAGQCVQLRLTVLRLRALEQRGPARGAGGALVAAAACGTAWVLVFVFLLDSRGLQAGLLLAGAAALGAFAFCAVRGLLAGAARVARSGSPLARDAARWVRLTAGAVVASALSVCLVLATMIVAGRRSLEIHAAVAADTALNCVAVALLSGLEGPAQLRRASEEAFQLINQYRDDQLQEFYLEFLAYLDAAQVQWVRCRFLRQLAESGALMMRCQDVPADEAVVGCEGFPRARRDPKRRFVVSHPWLSKAHPDPEGVKLKRLVQQLDLLKADDNDAVFLDFMSVPQHDGRNEDLQRLERENSWPKPGEHPAVRTEAQEELFQRALGSMETLYSFGGVPVIVLPMEECTEPGKEYISRGWCLLEFCLALSFGNIANADAHTPVSELQAEVGLLRGDTVEGFREAFANTSFTCSGDSDLVLQLFTNTLNKRTSARTSAGTSGRTSLPGAVADLNV